MLFGTVIVEMIIHHFGDKNVPRRTVENDDDNPVGVLFEKDVLLLCEPKRPIGERKAFL